MQPEKEQKKKTRETREEGKGGRKIDRWLGIHCMRLCTKVTERVAATK
jgi:hypothetical protein